MEIPAKYNPALIEDKWYSYWVDNKFFHSEPNEKEAYTIVIPPPNVTGVLHMGHMLNNTIQDILVRRARMKGKNACWVPGTDHASIATEAKVVKRLAEQGIKKSDLTREEFLKHAWDWTNEHGGIILKQLRKLGASCDWDRTAFTMDQERSGSVIKVFVDLYNKGLIYRGLRMVNWDPKAQTALSNEEVIYKDEKSKLYYLKYYVEEAYFYMEKRLFSKRMFKSNRNLLKEILLEAGLRPRVYEILYRHYIEGESVYEISEQMGISYGSVNVMLSHAREELLSSFVTSSMAFSDKSRSYISHYFLS